MKSTEKEDVELLAKFTVATIFGLLQVGAVSIVKLTIGTFGMYCLLGSLGQLNGRQLDNLLKCGIASVGVSAVHFSISSAKEGKGTKE